MMKRIISAIVMLLCIQLLSPIACADELDEFTENISQSAEEGLPENVKDELSNMDISLENPESLSEISVYDILDSAKKSLQEGFVNPVSLLAKLVGILLMCSIASSMCSGEKETDRVYETICVLSVIALLFDTLGRVCSLLIDMLSSLSGFMSTYLPVYISVTTASAGQATASASGITLLALSEVVSLCANKLLPLVCSVMLACSIAQSISPMRDYSVVVAIRKFINKIIVFASTLFIGVISVSGIVGASADTVAVRCAKFTASSFVPVIGSSVAEAYTTVKGSLSLLRSATGAFGILVVVLIALRPVLVSVGLSVVIYVAKAVAELFSLKGPKAFLGGVGEMMSVIMTSSILLSLVFVISTAVLMLSCVSI